MPTISFDLVGTTAGRAYYKQRHVQLNAVLLTENISHFETNTIAHELAHLLVFHVHNAPGGHGPNWKAMMHLLGVEPRRCHRLDVSNARTRKRLDGYGCKCGPKKVSSRMFKHLKGGGIAHCTKCKSRVWWMGGNEVPAATRMEVPAAGAPRNTAVPSAVPSPHPASSKAPARAPSEAMLKYAVSLALKHKIELPLSARTSFEHCRQFLDKWSKALAPVSPGAALATSTEPPPPGAAPVSYREATATLPTERQLAYAASIAARKKIAIPQNTLVSRSLLSAWIESHR